MADQYRRMVPGIALDEDRGYRMMAYNHLGKRCYRAPAEQAITTDYHEGMGLGILLDMLAGILPMRKDVRALLGALGRKAGAIRKT